MDTFTIKLHVLRYSSKADGSTPELELYNDEVGTILDQLPLSDMIKYFTGKGYSLVSKKEITEQQNDSRQLPEGYLAVYYRGSEERGAEIIEAVEKLGGKNVDGLRFANDANAYYISPSGRILICDYQMVKRFGKWTELHLPDKPKQILDEREAPQAEIRRRQYLKSGRPPGTTKGKGRKSPDTIPMTFRISPEKQERLRDIALRKGLFISEILDRAIDLVTAEYEKEEGV